MPLIADHDLQIDNKNIKSLGLQCVNICQASFHCDVILILHQKSLRQLRNSTLDV